MNKIVKGSLLAGVLGALALSALPSWSMAELATAADLTPVRANILILTRQHHCLEVEKGRTKNGIKVQFSTCHGHVSQRWTLTKGGYLIHQYKQVRKCLSAPVNLLRKGTALRLWDCNNVSGQRWFYKKGRLFYFSLKKVCA